MNSFSVVFPYNHPTLKEHFMTQWSHNVLSVFFNWSFQSKMFETKIVNLKMATKSQSESPLCTTNWSSLKSLRFQPVEKITACWSQSDSLDDKIYFSTEDHHLCEKLHLDIGSTAAACLPVCHWQDTFSAWLLVLPNASIRSVRHVSTIVALSVAEVGVAERSGFGAPGRSSLQNIKRLGLAGWLLLFYIYI